MILFPPSNDICRIKVKLLTYKSNVLILIKLFPPLIKLILSIASEDDGEDYSENALKCLDADDLTILFMEMDDVRYSIPEEFCPQNLDESSSYANFPIDTCGNRRMCQTSLSTQQRYLILFMEMDDVRYSIPEEFCPICQFIEYSEYDTYNWNYSN